MKKTTAGILCSFVILCSCTYSKFVLTGNKYDPLPEEKEVKVIPWGNQADYDVIGVVEIGESDIETRINEAKSIARMNGGDTVAPKGIEAGDASEEGDVGYRLQSFMILKSREVQETAKVEEPPREEPPRVETAAAEDYPKASFKLLREEYASLKGQKFQGALYPYRFRDIPTQIIGFVEGDKKLLELRTKSGKARLYLLLPGDQVEVFENMIKSRNIIKFVYTPLTVYRRKYPVVDFIAVLE
jgi:hypothetical protein